jgi:hypothetical protein
MTSEKPAPKPLTLTPIAAALKGPPKSPAAPVSAPPPKEVGGPKGLEPTRYGDWERKGRCSDF